MARVDISELTRFAKDANVAALELEGSLKAALATSTTVGLAAAREGMPVFTGEGVNSILSKGVSVRQKPDGFIYRDSFFSTTPQVVVLDTGRRAGQTAPPPAAIRRWVELKVRRGAFDVSWTGETGSDAIDFATQKLVASIKRRGIPGRGFFLAAAGAAEATLRKELELLADKFRNRVGRL